MQLQELAVLADFDHLQDNEIQHEEFGDLVFKKEFYSRALCVGENEKEMRLKKFARSWLEITETGDEDYENIEISCAESIVDDDWIP